jgi:prepilin-type N-terminal cleavage/methylation domain-containing protein
MRSSRGFSLVELMVVVALMVTAAAIAVPVSSGMLTRIRADSATVTALATIQGARTRAVAERRNVQINFIAPNRITVARFDVSGTTTTIVEDVRLTENLIFRNFADVPDTPDAFGGSGDVNFSGTSPVMFTSEGTLVDANGDVSNGTVFIGRDQDTMTARAITFFGVSGYVRTWKWNGASWLQ